MTLNTPVRVFEVAAKFDGCPPERRTTKLRLGGVSNNRPFTVELSGHELPNLQFGAKYRLILVEEPE